MNHQLKTKIRNLCNKNSILKKLYKSASSIKANSLAGMSDAEFVKRKYQENAGRILDLENPKTFNEKLCWLKVYNHDPLMTKCADKVKVRDYVKECGLGHILNEVYGVYDSADDIDFDKLPDKCFLKCNHGSGTNIIFDRSKPFDIPKFRKEFNEALKTNYYLATREWAYKNIESKIICEKILETKDELGLVDYNFFCFHGQPKFIMYNVGMCSDTGKHAAGKRLVLDSNFNVLDIETSLERFDIKYLNKPNNFDEMLEYAQILSEPFPHVRVDFYNLNGKIIMGEMTFYSASGHVKLKPYSWDEKIGTWIDLKSEKIKLDK